MTNLFFITSFTIALYMILPGISEAKEPEHTLGDGYTAKEVCEFSVILANNGRIMHYAGLSKDEYLSIARDADVSESEPEPNYSILSNHRSIHVSAINETWDFHHDQQKFSEVLDRWYLNCIDRL